MTNEKDRLIDELIEIARKKREQIQKTEKPNWITNCSFRVNEETSVSVNLQVCSDVKTLVGLLGKLYEKKNGFDKANKFLNTNEEFTWFGHTLEEWGADIKTRIDKLNVSNTKKELEIIESKLNSKISKERRDELELEEIKKQLGYGD